MEYTDVKRYEKERRITKRGPMDLPFAMLVVLLSCIGLVMMFSASYASASADYSNPTYYFVRQGIFVALGVVVLFIVSQVNYLYFKLLSVPALGAAVVLLVLVLFIGKKVGGARRWIDLGFTGLQPSEIAKIAVIMMFATLISSNPERLGETRLVPALKGIAPYIAILGVITGLLYFEPHISGIILIVSVGCVMLFMGGLAWRWILGVISIGGVGLAAIMLFTDHARRRLDIWLDPWSDPMDAGFQAIQSLYAVGSGGMFGLGLGQSRQKQLYLPEAHNDFVFAIVCEELGLFGALLVLVLFMLLIVRGYWIALHSKETFGSLLVSGVTTLLAIQVFLNVAVVTSLIPVTGISMPFFSYGGSSLLIMMAEMGIVLSVSRHIT